jgi:hypothetical protein
MRVIVVKETRQFDEDYAGPMDRHAAGHHFLATTLAIAQQPAGPGDALPGLTATEFEEFRLGLGIS